MQHKTMNGQNYFNQKSFEEMCAELEKGETISVYIDCIGHSRTAYESDRYEEALKEKYGDRLVIDYETTYTTLYSLKI